VVELLVEVLVFVVVVLVEVLVEPPELFLPPETIFSLAFAGSVRSGLSASRPARAKSRRRNVVWVMSPIPVLDDHTNYVGEPRNTTSGAAGFKQTAPLNRLRPSLP
jgi:hypothetical protein